jgi:hypothetical protein
VNGRLLLGVGWNLLCVLEFVREVLLLQVYERVVVHRRVWQWLLWVVFLEEAVQSVCMAVI